MVNLETPIPTPKPKNSLSLVYRNSDQSVSEKLLQPLNVAIVVSVVIHGVAGYGLPSLPFFQRPSVPKEVRIVELTPQEQSRIRRDAPPLPPSVSGVPLPGVPNQQGTAVNPGLYSFVPGTPSNNFGSGSSGRTNFPSASNPWNILGNEDNQARQGTSTNNLGIGSSGRTNSPNVSNPRSILGNEENQAREGSRQLITTELEGLDASTTTGNFRIGGRSIFNRFFRQTSPSNIPSPSPLIAVAPSTSPTSSPSPLAAISPSPSPSVTLSPSPSPSGSDVGTGMVVNPSPTSSPSPSTGNNGETGTPGNSGENSGNGGNGGSVSPNGVTPNPLLAFDPSQTELTEDGLSIGFTDFLGEGNEVLLQQDRQVKLTLDVPYPSEACGPQLGGTAILGMILNEEGAITKGPTILQSSGYGIFNQAAIEAAKAYPQFSPAKVYIVTVPFAYSPEVCPGGSNE